MTAFWSFSDVVHAGWLPKQMIAQDKFSLYFPFFFLNSRLDGRETWHRMQK